MIKNVEMTGDQILNSIHAYDTVVFWIHRVEDILLGFEPKDPGSIPGGSVHSIFINALPDAKPTFSSRYSYTSADPGADACIWTRHTPSRPVISSEIL